MYNHAALHIRREREREVRECSRKYSQHIIGDTENKVDKAEWKCGGDSRIVVQLTDKGIRHMINL